MQKSLKTSVAGSTSKGKVSFPYWSEHVGAKSSMLWFPTKTDSPESDLTSLSGLSNLVVGQYAPLINLLVNKDSITKTSFHTSLFSATRTMVRDQVVTKKIRIYPNDKKKWISLCDLSRYAYNGMVAINRDYLNNPESFSHYRKGVTDKAKYWDNYVNHVIQESCREADISNKAIIKKRKNGEKCELSFRSRKSTKQGFRIQKLGRQGIYPRYLKGGFTCTEEIPNHAYGKSARVIFEYDQWFLCCQDITYIENQDISNNRIVSIDQGVRTFLHTYSPNESIEFGRDYQKNSIMPLLIEMDQLLSKRSLLPMVDNQRNSDLNRYYTKKINKLKVRVRNLKKNLYRISADVLTKNYDVILMPTFEVSDMVSNKSKLSSKTCRAMLSLGHFEFKIYLKWIAHKRGKVVIDVCESYTSKTNPFNGELMDIGSKRSFKYKGNEYDRDLNGSRNIFIKNTMGVDAPLYTTTFETSVSNVA